MPHALTLKDHTNASVRLDIDILEIPVKVVFLYVFLFFFFFYFKTLQYTAILINVVRY